MFSILNFLPRQMTHIMLVFLSCQFLLISTVSAFALPDPTGEKAKAFADIFNYTDTDQVYEDSAPLENMQHHIIPTERARALAEGIVRFKLSKEYISRIYAADLGLTDDNFSMSGRSIPFEEISETVEERTQNGVTAKYLKVSFRQKPIVSDSFNPFIEKKISILPASIEKAEYKDGHWVIEANGYGYYESNEGIDDKETVAGDMARTAAFDIVTKKVLDLGIVSADKAPAFRQELAKKKRMGGIYDPTGCGVYFTKSLLVWVSADGAILDDLE